MRGTSLAILGLGAPLLVMAGGWRLWMRGGAEPPASTVVSASVGPGMASAAAPRLSPARHASAAHRADPPSSLSLERIEEAVDEWRERLERLSATGDDPHARAARLLADRRYDQAVRAYDRLLAAEPDDVFILLGKAAALAGAGRFEDALPLYENLVRREPRSPTMHFDFAVAQMREGRMAEAVTLLRRVLELEPRHRKARFNLAVALQGSNRPLDALAQWRAVAAEADAADAGPWYHLGECAIAVHQYAEAEQCFERVVGLRPDDPRAWTNLGIARAAYGRRPEALAALDEALRLDAGFLPAMNQAAFVHAAIFADTESQAHFEATIDFCGRSLAVNARQPNIIALREALLHPPDPEPDETSDP
jgi:tetratricopeptide (TPR) repeat protein